ncbi:MAG: type IV toxin-antitoxin system AbiEi family antitoxin domain-containing protein [Candidatus Rokubacteria bacterium]|nr:type IV toxin-antitoxin system AbiEi family antitoxin domain-containing protein [Candidatus Rokubacteria bacterium]
MPAKSNAKRVLDLIRRAGVLRARDLDGLGIPREHLVRLMRRGQVERVGRGLYRLAGAGVGEHQSLAEACKLVPHGMICLLSALRFHGLTTQNPAEIWMAIGPKAWKPGGGSLALRIVRLSGPALAEGVEEHRIRGVTVHVYSAAKTVADCFKFRNKIGLDVALEALRDYRRAHRGGMDELWGFARICRVTRVMRPYLEALA